MNTQKLTLGLVGVLTMMTYAACGARDANAPRVSSMAAGQVSGDFPWEGLTLAETRLDEAQLFLWKPGYSPADVSYILGQVEELDQYKIVSFNLNRESFALQEQIKQSGVEISQVADAEKEYQDQLALVARLLIPVQDFEKMPAPSDEEKKKFEKAKKAYDRQNKKLPALAAKLEELLEPLRKANLVEAYETWKKNQVKLNDNTNAVTAVMQKIDAVVSLFNSSPIGFSFEFDGDQPIRVKIKGWDLADINDEAVKEFISPIDYGTDADKVTLAHDEFSTEERKAGDYVVPPAIRNVTYSRDGGVFVFEVYTPKAVFWFKLVRANYGAVDGRIYYKGDIVRCSVAPSTGQSRSYGLPALVYVNSTVVCGMTGVRGVRQDQMGVVYERRGVANLVNRSDKIQQ